MGKSLNVENVNVMGDKQLSFKWSFSLSFTCKLVSLFFVLINYWKNLESIINGQIAHTFTLKTTTFNPDAPITWQKEKSFSFTPYIKLSSGDMLESLHSLNHHWNLLVKQEITLSSGDMLKSFQFHQSCPTSSTILQQTTFAFDHH